MNGTDPARRAELELRSAMSDMDLLVLLTSEVMSGVADLDEESRRRVGWTWLEAHLEAWKEEICNDPRVVATRSRVGQDVEVAAAVADVLSTVAGAIPVATAAVLVVRYGLDRLCE